MRRLTIVPALAFVLMTSTTAIAQTPASTAAVDTTMSSPVVTDPVVAAPVDDDHDFPWGLLGLLGLAGLLGRKRNDEVRVYPNDNTTDKRP